MAEPQELGFLLFLLDTSANMTSVVNQANSCSYRIRLSALAQDSPMVEK